MSHTFHGGEGLAHCFFEHHLVAQRVHALPITDVFVCGELSIMGQSLHRFLLPNRQVVFHIADHLRLEHKKAAVDPCSVTLGFLAEASDAGVVVT